MSQNQQEFFSTDSDALDLDLARIEYKIQQGKRGHVTYASMMSISLIGAWTSTVLLGFLIAAIIAFFTFIPNNISMTLNNGILFLRSITDGYELAMQNLPPCQATSSLKQYFSNALETFYEIPFPIIRKQFDSDTVNALFPILAETPIIAYDVQDMIWFVGSVWRYIFSVTSPTDYIFPSDRYYPFTVILNDANDTYSINGEFVDLSALFPGVFEKRTEAENVSHILSFDNRWHVYRVITAVRSTEELQDIHNSILNISVQSVQFYDPMYNQVIVLNRRGPDPRHFVDSDGLFDLQFVETNWTLTGPNISRTVHGLQPFASLSGNFAEESFGIHVHEIEVNVNVTGPNATELNGIYCRINSADQWRSNQFNLYDLSDQIDALSTYIKVVQTLNYSWTLYKLTHKKSDIGHVFELTSHEIANLYESRDSYDVMASIDSVKWNKLKLKADIMEPYDEIYAKTKSEEEWQAPHIQKVILRYKQESYSSNSWHAALCFPFLKLQEEELYFKLRTEAKRIDHIVAALRDVNIEDNDCEESGSGEMQEAYLNVAPLMISSEVLGGKIEGSADVFFRDINTCNKWRVLYIETINSLNDATRKSTQKNSVFLNQEIKQLVGKGVIRPVFKNILQRLGWL